ncbi:TPA: alcohol dehydrogenase catalytic domain-containing protein [Streptococcus suis]|nr:alcohol dehydrogenase catalytic domain-containing protein [Streptococcus suis]
MKAVVVSKAGGPEVLEVREVTKPQVKTGWSLVKIKGFGINHSEIFTRQGLSPSVVLPRILGIELVGVIEKRQSQTGCQLGLRKSLAWIPFRRLTAIWRGRRLLAR